MQILYGITLLVLSSCLAMIVQNWLFRKISVNYVALMIGILIALIPQINTEIFIGNPEVFMGLIVAPLLFFEGQNNSLYAIARRWKSIVSITVVMIIIATVVAAFGIKWLIGLALPLSFILAAISTPTDATATESVIHGLKMPSKVSKYLQNESLFNDASGIILLEMATTWYLSKKLEITHTVTSFLYSAGGGIILGLMVAGILVIFRQKLVRTDLRFVEGSYNPANALIAIYLLTPFLLYYFAEWLHVSGIIAVVVAGLVHRAEFERSRLTNVYMIYNSTQLSNFISDFLNTIVFIGLGLTIVKTSNGALLPNRIDLAIWIGIILYIANIIVRYLYSFFVERLSNRDAWIFALGGIHGAVTFALAYTLDHTLISNNNFHLILFSEAVLIILSMVIPTILFKFILPKEKTDLEQEEEIDKIRRKMVDYALKELDKIYLPKKIRKQIKFDLNAQINETSMQDFLRELKKSIRNPELSANEREFRDEVYRYAFRLERNYLGQIAQQKQEYRSSFRSLYRQILLAEVIFLHDEE
ncbi:cation:proton antiporter [Lactobacillus sp. LL6]|uniref:cation:proton antiporter n=1 Tax=Lactobacillus sp. LL6 TaxID=2596827 RepID=UPI001184AA97|nr:cation:proton antiporter [Lactobacillus sp. LL6]TSO26269.1 sodium:proton antiporter [Lactobacillus sp. LL6]